MVDNPADTTLEHEYDGIREYDNRLPNWWLATLYGAIIFALGYWLYYHTLGAGLTQDERFAAEVATHAERELAKMAGMELTDEALLLMSQVTTTTDEGRTIFEQHCVQCHNAQGEGNIGPNLTDRYWLHGGRPLQIHETVTHGVIDKGMQAWGSQLGPSRILKVVAYVLTLKGTNVPGKEPQGEPEADDDGTPVEDDATTPAGDPARDTSGNAAGETNGKAPGGDPPGAG